MELKQKEINEKMNVIEEKRKLIVEEKSREVINMIDDSEKKRILEE